MRKLKRTYSTEDAIRVLRDGIAKGYWTLEDLDTPPPGTKLTFAEYRRYCSTQGFTGKTPVYRNLLRELEDNQEDDFIL
jgi:hypothetical protein